MRISTLLIGTVLLAADAHAMVLCTSSRGSGTVRVREVCRANETQLDPVALGLQGPPGTTGTTGAIGAGAFVLKDSMGNIVGPIVAGVSLPAAQVAVVVDGRQLLIDGVTTAGFTDTVDATLYYEHTGCTGQAFAYNGGQLSAFVQVAQVHHGAILYAAEPAMTRGFVAYSQVKSLTDCPGPQGTFLPPDTCCFSYSQPVTSADTVPLTSVPLASLGLVPPFHIEGP